MILDDCWFDIRLDFKFQKFRIDSIRSLPSKKMLM